jgi:3-phenylpropionate/trans-cinnamate dioxygenase ferredoxin subunit
MPRWTEVAKLDELTPNQCRAVTVEDVPVVLVRQGDEVFALHNVCSHMDYPLHEGDVDDTTLMCPLHGAKFDLRTGAVRAMPAARGIKSFAVSIEGGAVRVDADEVADV